MPGRPMATRRRRRHAQARRMRRFEMERPSVVAVINSGAAWTTVNAQRLPGLALALGSLIVLAFLFTGPQFFVYDAGVSGQQRLSAEQVYQASGIDTNSIFFLAPRVVEARLLAALPGLHSARVALNLPARVEISVVEKEARFAWVVSGVTYLADERGLIIGSGEAPGALLIRADESAAPVEGQALDEAVLSTVVGLSQILGAREFEYSPGQGVSWRTEQGWPVCFGVGGDLAGKVAVMRTVAAELESQGFEPEFLDVSVASRPFYR